MGRLRPDCLAGTWLPRALPACVRIRRANAEPIRISFLDIFHLTEPDTNLADFSDLLSGRSCPREVKAGERFAPNHSSVGRDVTGRVVVTGILHDFSRVPWSERASPDHTLCEQA